MTIDYVLAVPVGLLMAGSTFWAARGHRDRMLVASIFACGCIGATMLLVWAAHIAAGA